MQAWLKTADTTAPQITIQENYSGDAITFAIESDEPIFQKKPFIAVKNIYDEYQILNCRQTGENRWETLPAGKKNNLVKAGIAVTDSVGNLSTEIIRFLPDDLIIDNIDAGFTALTNNFVKSDESAWGINSDIAELQKNDSAIVSINLPIEESRLYNLFFQFAPGENLIDSFEVKLLQNGVVQFSKIVSGPFEAKRWEFLSAADLSASENNTIILKAVNGSEELRSFSPDVLKASAVVPEKRLEVSPKVLSFGEVSIYDSVTQNLKYENLGIANLSVYSISSLKNIFKIEGNYPVIIEPHSSIRISVKFSSDEIQTFSDTLLILCDDGIYPEIKIPVLANANQYFEIVDNEDSAALFRVRRLASIRCQRLRSDEPVFFPIKFKCFGFVHR